jgi:hypothetical protein
MGKITRQFSLIICLVSAMAIACSVAYGNSSVKVPKTGQVACYGADGKGVACPGTGQDGETRKGIDWPNPRFAVTRCDAKGPCADPTSDCDGNALTDVITDNLTGLMWARNGNLTGKDYNPWEKALDDIASSNRGNGLCGYTDWRLPNVNELESLINAQEPNTAQWLNSQGFVNVQPDFYWSSTVHAQYGVPAWVVSMVDGTVSNGHNTNYRFAWQVRAGQRDNRDPRYPANLWKTGQVKSLASRDDADLGMGVEWPRPRFKENGDGTVTDNLTGLVWTKDANAPGPAACKPQAPKKWLDALGYVACLNANRYLGFDDWRLPNRKEFITLVDRARYNPVLPEGHPFSNLQLRFPYYSSTTAADYKNAVWTLSLLDGTTNLDYKPYLRPVWPLRGGGGADLTGSWLSLSQACRGTNQNQKCTLTGSLKVVNRGSRDLSPSNLKFYLSEDGTYGEGDKLLNQEALGKIKTGESKTEKFSYGLPPGETASGKYIIAVIASSGAPVSQPGEGDDLIVCGRIP